MTYSAHHLRVSQIEPALQAMAGATGKTFLASPESVAVTAWFAWLAELGPIGWITAFWLGVFATVAALLGLATLRLQWAKAKYTNSLSERVTTVNPLDDVFERKRIRLSDFYVFPPIPYFGKSFIDCHLFGPVNIRLSGLIHLDMTRQEQILEYVKIKHNASTPNAIFFHDITFHRCTFYNVTFLVGDDVPPEAFSPQFNWITESLWPEQSAVNHSRGEPSGIQPPPDT